jgi:starch synthase
MRSGVRALFMNSGILGHASVASLISDAISRDPQIEATHVDLAGPLSVPERVTRRALCARPLGATNLDFSRWRSELHSGRLAVRRIRPVLDSSPEGLDVLHFHTQATAYASLRLMEEIPSIVSIDITQSLASLEVPGALRFTYRPNILHDGAVFRRAAAIVSTSRWAADDLARQYPDCAGRTSVLPYPVRLEQPAAKWIDERYRRAGSSVRFLFVGGDFPRKGGPDLLRVWQDGGFAPTHRLTLVTDWPLDARRLPAGVQLVPGVKPYTLAWRDLWRDADVFVMPARAEAFGMVYQEAAAAGLPAIGTRINAVPEIVGDEATGLLVPPGDSRALVDAVRALAASADRRRAMGTSARSRMESTATIDRYGAALAALVHRVARRAEAA